ncbi:MAG: type II toxin-antitoxin system RelE/ParE family toxin [Candidatus Taylorbacteria bacterium]|nr:type II toxin-antitoxin system RelE/ParE family toxin [Candidatus Taylorbacteria bacterium]
MNSNRNWALHVDPDVYRYSAKFSMSDRRRIFEAVESLKENPYAGDIEKIKGEENRWRRRVGVYRIFYKIYQESRAVVVVEIKRRGSHTY